MRFQTQLVPATLIRRYKRFLADCLLDDGREITAHIANPGSMLGLAGEGQRIWLEPNDDPKKKLKWAWRLVEQDGAFVGVDTGAANRIVKPALQARTIAGLDRHNLVRPEVKYGENSRIDFLLSGNGPDTYVEVKSVTLLRQPGLAEFPDSKTARGTKHLGELSQMVADGHRAVMLYLVQRTDARRMRLAEDIDPAYAAAFQDALRAGVEVMALGCDISPEGITLAGPLDVEA
ncbi:DNA/RNA nuclease SfsA [Sagittula sp. SSi028]|uniref:DNA/RNA nuclease SfsA n=1 Tax=Sagittula sp. SSi028 TaxID=3400636 RepID=UPI003AF90683